MPGSQKIALTNFPMGNTRAFVDRALAELDNTGALAPRVAQPNPVLGEVMKKLLAIYHQWDETAMKAILGRPLDPREQGELATYKQLHGTCTGFELKEANTPLNATFAMSCERGTFELTLATDARGKILGFIGFSRGVAPPAAFAKTARAVVALHDKWDDKTYAKHLAKSAPAAEMKALAAQFHARHGDCKIKEPIHEGFDWGYQLACAKENVEMYLATAPDDPTQVVGIQLKPVRGEAKKCD